MLVGRVVAYSHCYGNGVLSGLTGKRGEEGARGGGSGPEGVGRTRGGSGTSPWRREDVGEAATAKQEVEARASPALATEQLRGEGEEDDREEEVGWAGQLRWAARWARMPGKLQVSALFIFCLFYFFKFILPLF